MPTEKTYDAEGALIQEHIKPATVTVQYGRKLGRENYGNEEFGLFAQIDVGDIDPDDPKYFEFIEERVDKYGNFLKGLVYKHLGVDSTILDSGIVRDTPVAAVAKTAAGGSGARPPAARTAVATGGGSDDKTFAWQTLLERPNDFFDNRVDKRNPKAPDFKGKRGTAVDGVGLWLSDAPPFVELVYPKA